MSNKTRPKNLECLKIWKYVRKANWERGDDEAQRLCSISVPRDRDAELQVDVDDDDARMLGHWTDVLTRLWTKRNKNIIGEKESDKKDRLKKAAGKHPVGELCRCDISRFFLSAKQRMPDVSEAKNGCAAWLRIRQFNLLQLRQINVMFQQSKKLLT
jgi:hypothetical protein